MEAGVDEPSLILQLPPSSLSHRHPRDRHALPLHLMAHGLQDPAPPHRGRLPPPPPPLPCRAHHRRSLHVPRREVRAPAAAARAGVHPPGRQLAVGGGVAGGGALADDLLSVFLPLSVVPAVVEDGLTR